MGAHWSVDLALIAASEILKVDEELGLVFGFAIVCNIDGAPYYDLNVDRSGERVPEHITEKAMLDAVTDFMRNSRDAKEMHAGDVKGSIVHSFPLTSDIAEALEITTKRTGWLVAMKPDDPAMLGKFKDGTLRGFSIGGSRVAFHHEEVPA